MRVALTVLISGVLGIAVGGALAYVEVYREGEPALPSVADRAEQGEPPVPQALVDEPEHDFGQMQRGTKKSHTFVFRNVGTAPLTLEAGTTSCKCTLSDVAAEPIPPDGSAEVRLEWTAQTTTGPYRQTAEIKTNDPLQPRITLTISGTVTEATGVSPSDIAFGKLRYGEAKSADVYVMSMFEPQIEVSEPQFSDPEVGQHLAVEIVPVERAQLPDPEAKAGVRVRVTTKPGLPLGRLNQWLAVKTNINEANWLEIPISGRVVGSVSVYGRNWNEDQDALYLGTVRQSEGAKAELSIIARGDAAEKMLAGAAFEAVSRDPPELKVSVGKPRRLSDSLASTPLVIEVPPGTPPMVRLNTSQGDEGHIVLRSPLPDAPEITINVRFAVQR